MTSYDLQEQQEAEQFESEDTSAEPLSKEVYQYLRDKKKYEAYNAKLNKKKETKHKATFTRVDNQNSYICDNCGKAYREDEGKLIYKREGEFAYCKECYKKLYPNMKFIKLTSTIKKSDFMSNHCDTDYYNRLH